MEGGWGRSPIRTPIEFAFQLEHKLELRGLLFFKNVSSGRRPSPGCVTRGRKFDCRFRFLYLCFQHFTLHRNHLAFRFCC